jgi:hypothetical protein
MLRRELTVSTALGRGNSLNWWVSSYAAATQFWSKKRSAWYAAMPEMRRPDVPCLY